MSRLNTITIEIGPISAEESCAQVGHSHYEAKSRQERSPLTAVVSRTT